MYLNGVLVETAAGTATSATVNLTLPGVNVLSLIATTVCGGTTAEVSCEVACPGLVPPPVTTLTCGVVDRCGCIVPISWVNGGVYDAILVLLDGVEVEALPGTATETVVTAGTPGEHDICIVPVVNEVEGTAHGNGARVEPALSGLVLGARAGRTDEQVCMSAPPQSLHQQEDLDLAAREPGFRVDVADVQGAVGSVRGDAVGGFPGSHHDRARYTNTKPPAPLAR